MLIESCVQSVRERQQADASGDEYLRKQTVKTLCNRRKRT